MKKIHIHQIKCRHIFKNKWTYSSTICCIIFWIILGLFKELYYNMYMRVVCMASGRNQLKYTNVLTGTIGPCCTSGRCDPASCKKSPRTRFLSVFFLPLWANILQIYFLFPPFSEQLSRELPTEISECSWFMAQSWFLTWCVHVFSMLTQVLFATVVWKWEETISSDSVMLSLLHSLKHLVMPAVLGRTEVIIRDAVISH